MSITEKIFILGAPRSGTTFLASLLSKTRFGAPFETHFITKYYHLLHKYGDLADPINFNQFIIKILAERPIMQWQLDLNPAEFYQQLSGNYNYAHIVDQLCLLRNKKYNLTAWGDKTPSYIGEVEIIASIFPDAKFLHIIRDGRDVALSLIERNWGPNNLYCAAHYWNNLNKKNKIIDELQLKGKLFSIQYETLLDNTELHIKDIYNFLDEDLSNESIEKLCSKVKKGNYNKWKTKLSEKDIKIFESISAQTLNRLGYETSYPNCKINPLIHYYNIICDKILWLKFMFIINIVDGIKIRFFGKQPFAE